MKPGLKVLVLGTLMTVPSLSDSAAKVTYSEKTIHYTVNGRTGQEIYSQISRKGPLLTGQPDHKVATTTMTFDVRGVEAGIRGTRCVVTNVDVHVDVVYRVPKWTGKGSSALRKAWAAFEAHLWRHERRHRDIGLDYARRVESDIRKLSGDVRRECVGMVDQARRLATASSAWHDRKQQAFDASWFGDGGQQFKYDRALMAAK